MKHCFGTKSKRKKINQKHSNSVPEPQRRLLPLRNQVLKRCHQETTQRDAIQYHQIVTLPFAGNRTTAISTSRKPLFKEPNLSSKWTLIRSSTRSVSRFLSTKILREF